MDYQIHPLKGTDQFQFGMTREKIRALLSQPYETGESDEPGSTFDQYLELGITLHYQSDFHLDGIEIYAPARAIFHGVDLLALTRGEATSMLTKLDPETRVEFNDVMAFGLSLSTLTLDRDDLGEDALIDNVAFGVAGFFGDPDLDFSKMDVWELADGLGEVAQEFVREYFGERPDPKVDPQQG